MFHMRKIIVWVLMVLGAAMGSEAAYLLTNYFGFTKLFGFDFSGTNSIVLILLSGVIGGIIFYFISSWLINIGKESTTKVERMLQKIPTGEMLVGAVGLIIGLIIAYLISSGPIKLIPFAWLGTLLSILVYLLLGYLGVSISSKKREDILLLLLPWKRLAQKDKEKLAAKAGNVVQPKILDTSVIIDGRIADICKTGFVEGPLIIPAFVLEELRHIADSSDALKRNRGRRGLDILNRIQKELDINVEIVEKDFEELSEVDTKLLKLAQYMSGKVITNDYNLNKVAEFQRVPVLNINELANAVKPVVLPGEEMTVQVIKDGKEFGQGVAYLDDGTMIVVDGGKRFIGETIEVIVTSVLQTAAGRMIFVKPKSAEDKVS
ncbi:MAG TPA: PIN/TRAM domain-containing protein [Bacillota bacterium]|nr:PIN/TRAM domain-containing protein [Bacillota bacterium]HPL54654.1 PIN/TRAM domain-containing protein [Bacillota bacterium]